MDITGAVITADAMHCQRETADHITGRGGHYVLTVKANQPTLRAACKALPWRDVPAVTTTDTSHGRRVRRTIKAVQVPDWIDFPGAAQIIQLRRTRTIKGRKTIEVVYAICSLDMIAAPPATVATWIQGHWAVENAFTGCVTWCSTRIVTSSAPATDHRSWPRCVTPRSACSASPGTPKSPPRYDTTAGAPAAPSTFCSPHETTLPSPWVAGDR